MEEFNKVLSETENHVTEFTNCFLEERVAIVEGTINSAFEPGETAEGVAKLGYVIKTHPHEVWDALKSL